MGSKCNMGLGFAEYDGDDESMLRASSGGVLHLSIDGAFRHSYLQTIVACWLG